MPPITVMVNPVSGACNMRCRYCFHVDEMRHRKASVYPRMTGELLNTMVRCHPFGGFHRAFPLSGQRIDADRSSLL